MIPALALVACGGGPRADGGVAAATAIHGPRADYPVIVGMPYTVAGTTYTPEDVLNYDEVGFLTAEANAAGVTAAHHTLPLPSYVEVTSLDTGRTIVVRVERRGPMDGNELLALSPAALEQLAATEGTPVRVRRVNPPEEQRALLRSGDPAEPRMDTPMSLVEILKRKLPARGSTTAVSVAAASPVAGPGNPPPLPLPVEPAPAPAPKPAAQLSERVGAFVVQAASFSTEERAERAARALKGDVTRAGAYFRVRTGPFATRGEAEASLAKVKAAGYSDARILTNG